MHPHTPMTRLRLFTGIIVLSGLCALFCMPMAVFAQNTEIAGLEMREWRALGGHSLTARFVDIQSDEVLLKDENDEERRVKLTLLLPQERAEAVRLDKLVAAANAPKIKSGGSNRLDVYADGPGKGFHAVHTHEKFVAKVHPNLTVSIQCLDDDGKPAGKPIRLVTFNHYSPSGTARRMPRKIETLKERYTPTLEAEKLLFEATMEGDVQFGIGLEFKDNTVQAWSWLEDPKGSKQPTSHTLLYAFPASHTFAPEVTVAEQKEMLAPFSVTIDPMDGKTLTFPFGDIAKGFYQAARSVEILEGVFGPRQISVTLGTTHETVLRTWIYRDYAPYRGFHVRLHKEDKTSRSEKKRLILTIE